MVFIDKIKKIILGKKYYERYLPESFKYEQKERRKKLLERNKRIKNDRKHGIYKRDSDYITYDTVAIIGKDDNGRRIAYVDGRNYVDVDQVDFGAELDAWRKDRSRPIPVGKGQKEHMKIFGD